MRQRPSEEPPIRIIQIDQIWNEVKKIVENAKDELVLVSPYNNYSVPLEKAVDKAARTVRIVAVCREEQETKEREHFKWLSCIGADVYLVSRLHAKIYYNESEAIVTSMNLDKGAAVDATEIGLAISDTGLLGQIHEYVQSNLIANGRHLPPKRDTGKPKPPDDRPPKAKPKQVAGRGTCIHCGDASIAYNPDKPLCLKCFRRRGRHKDRDYPEKYCHRCGEEHEVSMDKPLCLRCWRADQRN